MTWFPQSFRVESIAESERKFTHACPHAHAIPYPSRTRPFPYPSPVPGISPEGSSYYQQLEQPRRRGFSHSDRKMREPNTTPTKLVVRVLQDVVREGAFENYSDLTEAVKARCARLRIPYDGTLVSAAIDQLERGGRRRLVGQGGGSGGGSGGHSPETTRRSSPSPSPLFNRPPITRELSDRLLAMARPQTFPDESRRMDLPTRHALATKLRLLAERKPTRFEPTGCGYCGASEARVRGLLCETCAERLDRLTRDHQEAPAAPADFTFTVRVGGPDE